MHLRSCLVGSVLALGANALLVIPEVDEAIAPESDFPSFHPLEAYAAKKQQVELACTECPFPEVGEDGKVSWTDGFQTSLVSGPALEFRTTLRVKGHKILTHASVAGILH